MSDAIDSARSFLAEDPDPTTRGELEALVARASSGDAEALAELRDRFSAPLTFGTAGLRGKVEAGLARMNRLVVIKATHGFGSHLLDRRDVDARARGVVIGFDGRFSSRQFAEDAAAVLAGLGIPAHVFPDPVPTPLCAFAVRELQAAGGVMVTASHNPPKDNGYKVYRHDGAQIIPPEDEQIAARIASAPVLREIERIAPPDAAARGLRRNVDDAAEQAYLAGLRRASFHATDQTPLRIVYTAMHGVGHRIALRAFQQAGFRGVATVPSQADADGSFRTVAFPNPEEKGAMDLALALAEEVGAELVLANDPDADRLAVAVTARDGKGYRMLSGNEIGWLLADDALAHAATGGKTKQVVTTVVSSTLLSRMAKAAGAAYDETLTGFKWIADAERKGEERGLAFVFGYEEALGYSVGPLVRDKDGIGAALRMAELTRFLKARGKTLLERVDELLVAHGLSHQVQWSVTLAGAEVQRRMAQTMAALRENPPSALDGSPVLRVVDGEAREERTPEGRRPIALPRSDLLSFHAEDGTRLIARPSGTEPKIKFYLETVGQAAQPADVEATRVRLDERCHRIKAALLQRLGLA
jgi:phosphomannomutase